jgi:hypothetical protein
VAARRSTLTLGPMNREAYAPNSLPPSTVLVALVLLVIVLSDAVWDTVSNRDVIASAPTQGFAAWFWWAFGVFGVLVPVLFGIAIVARRRWARAALAVYFVLEWLVIVIGSAIAGQAGSLLDTKLLLGLGAEIAILALLFSAPTSQWFRAGSSKAA